MQHGSQALSWAPPMMLWAATLYKVPALTREGRQPAFSAYWSSIAWLAVAMTLLVAPLAEGVDKWVGVPNLAWPLAYATVLLSGFSATTALLHELGPDAAVRPGTRFRRYTCGGLLALIAGLFAVARTRVETQEFVLDYGRRPAVAALVTVFDVGLAVICLDMIPKCWRAGAGVTGLVRLALRGTAVAGGLSLVFVAYMQTAVVQSALGRTDAILANLVACSRVAMVPIVTLIAVGTSIPDWGPRLHIDTLGGWLRDYRQRRRLFALWFDLRGCVPTGDIPAPGGRRPPLSSPQLSRHLGDRRAAALRDVLTVHDAAFQLHRRVIDITDAKLAITDHHDPADAGVLLAELPPEHRDDAAVEAAALAAGVAARRASRPAHRTGSPAQVARVNGLEDWSMPAEVDHLARVASAYRRFMAPVGRAQQIRRWPPLSRNVRPGGRGA